MAADGRRARILIAGFGSVLHGDDGFGVEVVQRLQATAPWPEGVGIIEVGTGGIHLVQRLLDGYDLLVVVDAVRRDRPAGTLYLLEAEVENLEQWSEEQRREFLTDMHYAEPSRALVMAKALKTLPAKTLILGCQPERCDDLTIGLSPAVAASVPAAISQIEAIVREWYDHGATALLSRAGTENGGSVVSPGCSIPL
ncbi:MAG: hydrogenase maturation protease [Dehalococcoidia bacterium]